MKYKDPLQEIRDFRESHAKKFGYDMHKISEDTDARVLDLEKKGWKFKYVDLPRCPRKKKANPINR